MKKKPLVSIIIPTFNRAFYTQKCLESIKKQTYKNIEVVVVDQSSTDGTPKVAQKFKAKVVTRARPKFYSPPSKSRNIGFKVSKGDIILNLDSDMELSSKLVEEAVKLFSTGKYGALVVHEIDNVKGFWSKCKKLERRCYWGNLNIEAARFVTRDVFKKVKGYDERLNSGDDLNVHKRYMAIAPVGFCKNILHHNIGDLGFMQLMLKKFNYGKTSNRYFRRTKENPYVYFLEEYWCFLKNIKLLLQHPTIGGGMLFMKTSELFFGLLGQIVERTGVNINLNVYEKK